MSADAGSSVKSASKSWLFLSAGRPLEVHRRRVTDARDVARRLGFVGVFHGGYDLRSGARGEQRLGGPRSKAHDAQRRFRDGDGAAGIVGHGASCRAAGGENESEHGEC